MAMRPLYIGYDFGTSGARVTVIDDDGGVVADKKRSYSAEEDDWTVEWERALFQLTEEIGQDVREQAVAVAFDGTSSTTLLVDRSSGAQLAPAKLYNESQGAASVKAAEAIAPPNHTAAASTSTLSKVLTWHLDGRWQKAAQLGLKPCILHQADWLASLLHGRRDVSDWNNALKLGYDPGAEAYPEWLMAQAYSSLFPSEVYAPGAVVAPITTEAALRTGLPRGCLVCAGTTDSIAAFVAAGATEVGQAVTSLGSTMAIKLLSDSRVDDAQHGVYSHRLGNGWLVGGASNTGGAVLRQLFTDEQLVKLSARMKPSTPTGLDYYPLPATGERFPVNDPGMEPRLTPRPADDAVFLQGLFESMARIEASAYNLLYRLGATAVEEVLTAGGGAANPVWTSIRGTALGVPVHPSPHGEASYGAALLARQGARQAAAAAKASGAAAEGAALAASEAAEPPAATAAAATSPASYAAEATPSAAGTAAAAAAAAGAAGAAEAEEAQKS